MQAATVDRKIRANREERVDSGGGRGQHIARVANQPKTSAAAGRAPVFLLACWALGLVAFAQVLVAGMSLAARFEAAREVKIVDREVVKVVAVPSATRPKEVAEPVVIRPPTSVAPVKPAAIADLPPPTPLKAPPIADPVAEQLVTEAKQARVAGDMGRAVLKLEEAKGRAPNEPQVLFELGMVHEAMGVFDTASDYFAKVAALEPSKAGTLYTKAHQKLRDGFQTQVPTGVLSLGRVRVFPNPDNPLGQQVVLTIPVERAPGEEVNPNDVQVAVEFFNRSKRDGIVPLEDKSWTSEPKCSTEPYDYQDTEEALQLTYTIPQRDPASEHLFGELEYYGYVVSLHYKNKVVDLVAYPRDLAAQSRERMAPAADPSLSDPNLPLNGPDPNFPGVLPPP